MSDQKPWESFQDQGATADGDQKPWESHQDQGATAEGDQKPWETFGGETKPEGQGVFGTLAQGFKSTGRSLAAAADTYTGDNQSVVERAERQQNAPKDERLKGFYSDIESRRGEDDGLGDALKNVGGAIADNPAGAGLAVVEQAPNAVPTLAGGYLGAKSGGATGAALGTKIAGARGKAIGGAAGFVIGGLAGMFLGNTAIETGSRAMEMAGDGEFTDEEAGQAKREGRVKGGVLTAVDGLTLGAGRLVSAGFGLPVEKAMESATRRTLINSGVDIADDAAVAAALRNPGTVAAVREAQGRAVKATDTLRRRAGEAATLLTMESVGEGFGEYLGEMAATGEADITDAVLESLLSLGQSGVEATWNMRGSRNGLNALGPSDDRIVDLFNTQQAQQGLQDGDLAPADEPAQEPIVPASGAQAASQDAVINPVQRPSEAVGLDPEAGPISAAAAIAVDSGASPVTAEIQAAQQAALAEAAAVAAPQANIAAAEDNLALIDSVAADTGRTQKLLDDREAAQSQLDGLRQQAYAGAGDSAVSDADGYKARSSGRLERINKATSKDEIDEILKEHASDPSGHVDGYSRMEAKAKDAKYKIDNPPRTDLVEGYTSSSPRQAQMDVDRLNETSPGHELVRMRDGWGEYYAIKKPSASQGKGQGSRSAEQADDSKRAKALARINSEKGANFFSEQKAQAFIDSNGLSSEYTLEQQGRAFKVVPKSENAEPAAQQAAPQIEGRDRGDGWAEFTPESGTLNVPRAEMPQIKAEHRGAMVNFLNARGIAHQEDTVPAASLKPAQAEFSRDKVQQAREFTGGNRSILVSADGHVLDGHHQWMAAREAGEDVKVIRLDAPIRDLLQAAHEFPSSTTDSPRRDPTEDRPAGQDPLFRLNSNRQGITKQDLDGIVSLMARPGIDIVSVQSAKDLPPAVRQAIAGFESRAEGFLLDGTAYLIADNLATPQRAVAVMIHEVVGHHGVRVLFGDKAAEAYASIYRAIPADVKSLLAEKYKDQLRKLDHAGRVDLIADEFMAALSEHQISMTAMQRVVAIVRSALRRIFGREFVGNMSTGDILYILERAGKLKGLNGPIVSAPGSPGFRFLGSNSVNANQEAPAPDQAQQFEGLRLSLKNAGANVLDTLAVDQLISSDRIPTLTISDLEGMTIFPTIADRTAAAAIYTGIDSSQLQVAIPLLGGPNFPLRESNAESGVVWANRGSAVTGQKAARLKAGASHMMIVMGDANMHQSNTTVSNAFFATLSAYVRDKRITKKNAEQLTRMVRQSRTADPQVNASMVSFPGLTDQAKLDAYLHRISFNARRRLLDLLGTKGAQALGAPSMTKILDATREPSLAGQRWGDGVLLVEVDQVSPMVNLGEQGTQPHPDFPLGIRGKVTGRLEAPVNYEILWQDWLDSARENAISRGTPESKVSVRRAFELAKPAVTITPDLIARIGSIKQSNIDGPRQARLAADFAAGNWKTSDLPVNRGGVSPQEFADAIQNSDAYATLTPYTAKEIKAGIKAGTMRLFQLGQDGQIFFMLETRPDGRVDLASVVNNEQGARGIGAPAVLLKAIEEGATDLTAFAVANEKYPAGFLPTLYKSFGFDVTNSLEFDARYFRDDLPKRARDRVLQDAIKYWTDSTPGFNPDSGMPSVVEMSWRGTDADRENITERYFRGGLEGLLAGRADADAQASTAQFDAPDQQASQGAGYATDAGRATGNQGADNRPPVPSRAQRVVAGIAELNDTELRNLGLTTADRDAARAATRSADARFSLRGREQAGDRGGRDASRSLAPLPDAPSVPGFSGPDPRLVDVAEQYARANGIDLRRQSEYVDVDPARAARIADAYEAMPHAPQDPAVREAYENLIQQTRAQYDALVAAGYQFWFVDPSSPEGAAYLGSPWNAMRDIRENQSMGSYPTDDGFGSGDFSPEANPLLADTGIQWPVGSPDGQAMKPVLANDLFRVVHDAFGHGLEGSGFRARGEENAWQAHVRLFTGSAVGAITSETRGQNSWLNYGPHGERNRTAQVEDTVFADQKTGLMPEWTWTEGRAGDTPAEPRFSLAPPVDSPAFKRWFGDSKVVDADGNPLVMYHGSSADISEFITTGGRGKTYGTGAFFTSSPDTANTYVVGGEGGNVTPVYVSLKNPVVVDGGGANWNRLGANVRVSLPTITVSDLDNERLAAELEGREVDWDASVTREARSASLGELFPDELQYDDDAFSTDDLARWARSQGYDGVVFQNVVDRGPSGRFANSEAANSPSTLAVAFRPEQIKSAIGNNGNFDPTNPDIRYSLSGQTQTPAFKRWFGDSKVVDENGAPLRVYHGTNAGFTEFDTSLLGTRDAGFYGRGFYFTPDENDAADYADTAVEDAGEGDSTVFETYISLQNPFIWDMSWDGVGADATRAALAEMGIARESTRGDSNGLGNPEERRKFNVAVRAAGHDGVIVRDEDGIREVVAFRPEQIKSAIGNVGAYGQRPVTADEAARFGMTQDEANEAQARGDIRFSLKPTDKAYADAVEAGDMQAAQEMVIAAAEASGVPVFKEEGVTAYTVRRDRAPRRTQKAYKLFRVKRNSPGELFALFVGANDPLPQGAWLDAVAGPESSPSKTGKRQVKSKLGALAYRPGWHAGDIPLATHIGAKNQDGQVFARKDDEVWAEVEMAYDVDYQPQADANGRTKSGAFSAALADIKEMPVDGMYRYKTNPAMTGSWIISGSMRINRVLSEQEVNEILAEAGQEAMPWAGQQKGSRQWKTQPLDLGRWGLGTNPARNQKKLLDPVTYDDAGNVIPLSKRFNQGSSDPRFSLAPPTESAAFKRWFGDSKVVDAEGKPLVVYHGTARDFDAFAYDAQGDNFGDYEGAFPRDGFWFTDSPSNANWYAHVSANGLEGERSGSGQRTVPAYLAIQNPYRYTAEMFAEEGEAGIPSQLDLEEQGYDGLIVEVTADANPETPEADAMWREYTPIHGAPINWPADLRAEYQRLLQVQPVIQHVHYVAFKPTQIKSAIGNDGTFDPSNPDIRRSFAGRNAVGSDINALNTAQLRLASGDNAETVRQETGWHRGNDGKWRYEISDDQAAMAVPGQTFGDVFANAYANALADGRKKVTVADVLHHDELFAAYPALAGIPVSEIPAGERAQARLQRRATGMAIQVQPGMARSRVVSVLLHELQHGIQTIEGFARGGSARNLASDMDRTGAQTYRRLAGEVEARNTQARQRMTGRHRQHISPDVTADVADADVIVTFNGTDMTNGPLPSNAETRPAMSQSQLLRAFNAQFPRLEQAVRTMLQRGKDGKRGGVVLVDSADPLLIARAFSKKTGRPLTETVQMFSEDGSVNGFYDPKSGLTFLVTPNLDIVTAPAVLLHEMTHGQQSQRLDKRALDMLMNRANVKNPELRGFLDRVANRMTDAGEAANASEASAYIVEQAVIEGRSQGYTMADSRFLAWIDKAFGQRLGDFLRGFLGNIRSWMLRNGMKPGEITVDDLVGYAMAGVQRAAAGRVDGGDVAFSRDTITKTPAFKRWFGDSKVVDADGKPLVVYHGTGNLEGLTAFDPGMTGKGNDQIGSGFYFTTKPDEASSYTTSVTQNAGPGATKLGGDNSPGVIPAYLSIQKPLTIAGFSLRDADVNIAPKQAFEILKRAPNIRDLDETPLGNWIDVWSAGRVTDKMIREVSENYTGASLVSLEGDFFRDDATAFRAALRDVLGYDGVVQDYGNGHKHFVAWFPEQIKSAIGNNGNFDPTNPDIRYSRTSRAADAVLNRVLRTKATTTADAFDDLSPMQQSLLRKVGTPPTVVQASDWLKARMERAGTRIRQGIVDRYASLKELDEKLHGKDFIENAIHSSSWVLARMSSAASGAMQAMMSTGRLAFDAQEKVITLRDGRDTGGLTGLLAQLGSPAEVERWFGWVAANRAEKLMAEGRENLFTADEIMAGKTLNTGRTEAGDSRSLLYGRVFREFQQYRDDVLSIAEQTGIISAENRAMWRDEFYVPFYRVMEEEVNGGPRTGKGLSRQEAFKKLKGGNQNLNDLLENTLMNFHHLLSASLKNQAATQVMENAQAAGIARRVPESRRDTKTSTFILEGGRKVFYQVDDGLVFEALTALADPGLNNLAVRTLSAFKRVFTNMTTVTPQFIIANTMRDLMQAAATSPTSKNVIANLVQGTRGYRDATTRAEMQASGGAFSFGHLYGADVNEVKASLQRTVRGAQLVTDPAMVPKLLTAAWRKWGDMADTAENLSRTAVYLQNVEQRGRLRAAYEARDVMDFSQHGAFPAVRFLIRVVPFLNARLQGLDKLYRSGAKPALLTAMGKGTASDKQAAMRFGVVTGALTLASIALYLANADDDEFRKLEDWQKDAYWPIRIGDSFIFIPKPFEVGAIATMAERITEQMVDEKATGKLFADRMKDMMLQTFSFSPVPQAFQPVLDVYSNKDAFTGRQIESAGMERLSKGLRSRDNTTAAGHAVSAVSRVLGDDSPVALSPVQADHLIRGYLGAVGANAAGIIDTVWRSANGEEAPDKRWSERQPFRRFYRDLDLPASHDRYSTLFYEGLRETARVYADVKELQELGRTADARELQQDKRNMLALRIMLNQQQRRVSDINKRMEAVRRSDRDGAWKRRELDRLMLMRSQIMERAGKRVESARASS